MKNVRDHIYMNVAQVSLYECIYIYLSVCTCVLMHVCKCVCMHAGINVMYVSLCVCIVSVLW